MADKLRITLVKSTIGAIPKHKKTVEALGLRKLKGVSVSEFEERFGISMFKMFKIEDALDKKDLILDDGFIRINEDKLYISNEILNEIM